MASGTGYVYWRGGRFNSTSITSLLRVEKLSGLPIRVTQGGYNKGGVAASAGTHDGGGVIDISVSGWSSTNVRNMLLWLRRCGWAAWYRTPRQGFSYHIHAVRIGDTTASYGARAQVVAYRNGRNGLAGNGADDGPDVPYVTWAGSRYNPANAVEIKPTPTPKGKMKIGDKFYTNISTVALKWVLSEYDKYKTGKKTQVTREVACVQAWLRIVKQNPGPVDGLWGTQTQKAYNAFRKSLGWTGNDIVGAPGLSSLKHLRDKAKSKRKVV